MSLYIKSVEFTDSIKSAVGEVINFFPNVKFEEYIVIGYLDNMVILRFTNLDLEKLSLRDLSYREVEIRKIVSPNFVANFMGKDYNKFGLKINQLKTTLINCYEKLVVDQINFDPIYKSALRKDIEEIKNEIGRDCDIWEVQIDGENVNVLYFSGKDDKKRIVLNNVSLIPIKCDESFEGLVKGLYKAIKDEISLCEVLIDYQE